MRRSISWDLGFLCSLVLAPLVRSQSTVLCASDPSVQGYDSIAALNADMQTELARIADGGLPMDAYLFVLCPRMVLDASMGPLLPVLSDSIFACGGDAMRSSSCIIRGGSEQVRIEDSTLPNYVLQRVSFVGVTFAQFTGNNEAIGASISALASEMTTLQLNQVSFTDFDSDFVIRQSTGDSPRAPMTVVLEESIMTSGTTGVAFDNDGGILNIRDLQINEITATSLLATANGGASFLQDSSVSFSFLSTATFTTASATQTIVDTDFTQLTSIEDVHFVEGEGTNLVVSGGSVSDVSFFGNSWNLFSLQSQAEGTIMGVVVSRNSGLEFIVSATTGASVDVSASTFESNIGVASERTSAILFGISDASIAATGTRFIDNNGFSGVGIALIRTDMTIARSCFVEGNSEYVVTIDPTSTKQMQMNSIEGYLSNQCPFGPRLFQESDGSGCFIGSGRCVGECEQMATEDACILDLVPTNMPSMAEGSPTISPTVAPVVLPTEAPVMTNMTDPPSAVPTPSRITPMPTSMPQMGNITAAPTDTPSSMPIMMETSRAPSDSPLMMNMSRSPSQSPSPTVTPTMIKETDAPVTINPDAPTLFPTMMARFVERGKGKGKGKRGGKGKGKGKRSGKGKASKSKSSKSKNKGKAKSSKSEYSRQLAFMRPENEVMRVENTDVFVTPDRQRRLHQLPSRRKE